MDFFERQDQARKNTRYLILMFVLASVAIVLAVDVVVSVFLLKDYMSSGASQSLMGFVGSNAGPLTLSSLGTIGFIGTASLVKTAMLSSGGGQVAQNLGGTQVKPDVVDPLRRRLYNVVEEMSIASGVPVPEVYVMERESGINAFAAGFSNGDAAVAVTRGALENLNRAELQGVIGHEFSHIMNGDMRINMRLIGILFGILAVAVVGRHLLSSMSRRRYRSSNNNGNGELVALGLGGALMAIGYIGLFVGRLIKAAISRQREFLADASAVQFTRDADGLAGALKKIAGYEHGSSFNDADSEEVSHMLFSLGSLRLSGMFATHPPVEERILALDPSFRPAEIDTVRKRMRDEPPLAEQFTSAFDESPVSRMAAASATYTDITPLSVTNSVGNPSSEHVFQAAGIRDSIPPMLLNAAHSPSGASVLVVALLLDHREEVNVKQIRAVKDVGGDAFVTAVKSLHALVKNLGDAYRLPLVNLSFPAIKQRPLDQIQSLLALVEVLIEADNETDTFEYVLSRLLRTHLDDASKKSRRLKGSQGPNLSDSKNELGALFAIVARLGHPSLIDARNAYNQGMHDLLGSDWPAYAEPRFWVQQLDSALMRLDFLPIMIKKELVEALVKTISHDGKVTVSEAEILRGICGILHCPLPPFLFDGVQGSLSEAT